MNQAANDVFSITTDVSFTIEEGEVESTVADVEIVPEIDMVESGTVVINPHDEQANEDFIAEEKP